MLDDQFSLGAAGNDVGFLNNILNKKHESLKGPKIKGQKQFSVCHFAGDVTYDIDGFVEKNKDSVSEIITECLEHSK